MGKEDSVQSDREEGPRSFGVFLANLDRGAVQNELSARLHGLVGELERRALDSNQAAKGKLTVTFEVKIDAKGVAEIVPTIATKVPEPKCSRTVMYLTKGGNLDMKDQRQQSLEFREVPGGRREVRDVPRAAEQREV